MFFLVSEGLYTTCSEIILDSGPELNRHLHINHEFIEKLYSGPSLRATDSRNHITFNALLSSPLVARGTGRQRGNTWGQPYQ